MANYIHFTVPGIPIAQPRQRQRVVTSGGRTFASNYTPQNAPVNAFKAAVQMAAAQAYSGAPLTGPLVVVVLFVMPRPKSKIWKSRPMPRIPHIGKPDLDNVYKGAADALNGLLYVDDAQIFSATVEKYIAGGDEQPHCEISITELEGAT